jgi:catechol 2,3-dioxygenase-like lactoylglutathione lyase family enzyme
MAKKFNPDGLHHITIRVNNIAAAEKFYGEVLGFDLVRKMGQSMATYRMGTKDTLVIVEAETAYDQSSRDYRIDHFGFMVDTPAEVDDMAAYLRSHEVNIVVGPVNRKNGRFVFFTDPDGNMIEVFFEKQS